MLKAEQIQANYERHLKIIEHYLSGDRKAKVLEMIKSMEENYIMAPASSKAWYHNAFPGGYLDHVNRVVELSLKLGKVYESFEGTIDYTEEEMVFSALFHDLGKLGDGEKVNYLPQTSKWRKDNMQEEFMNNPELDYMLIQDRSLFILQKFGITLSQKEYLAIRLHDGIFDDANKAYFVTYNPDSRFKTSIVNIIHMADYMASKIEYDLWKKQ